MGYAEIIGTVAAVFTTTAFLPQAIKTWRSRSTEDISIAAITTLLTGQLLWLIYGLEIMDYPLICANIVSAALTSVIVYVKVRNMLRIGA